MYMYTNLNVCVTLRSVDDVRHGETWRESLARPGGTEEHDVATLSPQLGGAGDGADASDALHRLLVRQRESARLSGVF